MNNPERINILYMGIIDQRYVCVCVLMDTALIFLVIFYQAYFAAVKVVG
jgi:hypothetical protein